MKIRQVLWPKQVGTAQWTLAACGVLLVIYWGAAHLRPWSPRRGFGLGFGILAALVFTFEMLYPFRRPRARPLFTAKNWVQAHIYLGVVALLAVVIHQGFHLPRGGMGWGLLLLSMWTTATGLVGVFLQKWIPASLSEGLRVEALYERIPSLVERLSGEADALMADAGEVLDRFYHTEIRPALSKLNPSWAFLLNVRSGRERALEPFRRITQFVEPGEKEKVQDLMNIFTEKIELDAHYSLQGILRRWLIIHVPTAGVLMGLLAIHIFTWVWY